MEERQRRLATLTKQEQTELKYEWGFWARPNQIQPADPDWLTWLILAGRGFGKTRVGAEWVRDIVKSGTAGRVALVARTSADVRDTIVEGESGILAVSPPWFRPKYEPSKRRLTWPNGAVGTTFSADEPDLLRGPQHDAAWCDELAAWRYMEAWDQLQFGLRLGNRPRVCVTTTPRPIKIIRELTSEVTTRITRGSTYDNKDNLAPTFLTKIVGRYAGTRLGRQELNAEILDDNPNALWQRSRIEELRVAAAPNLIRVVIGVDPAVTSKADSALTGIVAAGLADNGHAYIIGDRSLIATPNAWARQVVAAYADFKGDRVIGETNNGGDLVEAVIRGVDQNVSYRAVHASRGKMIRAEPIAALYEQGRVHHVGAFPELEDQMCDYDPLTAEKSPDRMDALVWALTDLFPIQGDTGMLEWMRQEAQARTKVEQPPGMIVMQAAPGISTFFDREGRSYAAGANGRVHVHADAVQDLKAVGCTLLEQ